MSCIIFTFNRREPSRVEQGDSVTLRGLKDGPKFVVLDTNRNGGVFIQTEGIAFQSVFGRTDNYLDEACILRQKIRLWYDDLVNQGLDDDLVMWRTLDLTTWDGRPFYNEQAKGYLTKAAPLSMDEARKYWGLTLTDANWTITAAGMESKTDHWVLYVTDRNTLFPGIAEIKSGVRPALLVSPLAIKEWRQE